MTKIQVEDEQDGHLGFLLKKKHVGAWQTFSFYFHVLKRVYLGEEYSLAKGETFKKIQLAQDPAMIVYFFWTGARLSLQGNWTHDTSQLDKPTPNARTT